MKHRLILAATLAAATLVPAAAAQANGPEYAACYASVTVTEGSVTSGGKPVLVTPSVFLRLADVTPVLGEQDPCASA